MKYAIETKNLTKKYKKFIAVNSLNFKIKNQTIFGMLGPNGAGKTTTIKMLTCLAKPTSGTANVYGYDVIKNPNQVRENAELCSDYYGLKEDDKNERIDDLMELVDIKYAENKQVGQLSGGQKQKASLVASLVHRPEILFLDEPTIGLDPTTKRILWDIIQELNDEGRTIILCSHDMHEVDMLCDNVGIINTGNMVAYDTPYGLKDTLVKKQKTEFESIKTALTQIKTEEGEIDKSYLKGISLFIENINEDIINSFKNNPAIYDIIEEKDGRINLKVEKFNDNIVNEIIEIIIKNNGKIQSVYTEEPSLEDVFMDVTSNTGNNARA